MKRLIPLALLLAGCGSDTTTAPEETFRHQGPEEPGGCGEAVVQGCGNGMGFGWVGLGFLSGDVGRVVRVPIRVAAESGENMDAWGLDMRYPRDMLEYVRVSRSQINWNFFGASDWPDPELDLLRVGGCCGGAFLPAGQRGPVAYIHFRVLRPGTARFEWVNLFDDLEGMDTNCPFVMTRSQAPSWEEWKRDVLVAD